MKKALPLDTFEAFVYSSIIDKTPFCLEEKQGVLVNDTCSSEYNGVGDFKYQLEVGKNSFCTSTDQHAWPDGTNSLQDAWSMTLSAMTVEYE